MINPVNWPEATVVTRMGKNLLVSRKSDGKLLAKITETGVGYWALYVYGLEREVSGDYATFDAAEKAAWGAMVRTFL